MPSSFESHAAEVLAELDRNKRTSLEAIGQQGVSYAKTTITAAGRVDTGTMRDSISHQVKDSTVYIGTNTSYAIYHEMGTGKYIAGGRKTPWAYQDEEGEWHWTHGVPPLHMLKNAVANHINIFKQIIQRIMKS